MYLYVCKYGASAWAILESVIKFGLAEPLPEQWPIVAPPLLLPRIEVTLAILSAGNVNIGDPLLRGSTTS